jgi:glycine dehydrogenase subunit 2
MDMFRQAKWREKLIFEYDEKDGFSLSSVIDELSKFIPPDMVRDVLAIPDVSEPMVARHFTRLSQMNYSVDLGMYPLGSCTMKYNPKICDEMVFNSPLNYLHPLQPEDTVHNLLEILYTLKQYLSEITGMDVFSLQPAAGAHGEYTGVLIIKKYFEIRGEERNEILIPDSAHGTNPASAKMAGFDVIEIPSDEDGLVDIDALKASLSENTAGMMLTNPNTLGLFEKNIVEICRLVHEVGGLMYYDGANLNAIAGICRPGDMGFDIVHVNLHKTFGTPHGGGGPGSGPVGVKKFLREYLPVPLLEYKDGKYFWNWNLRHTIGKVHGYYGNISVLLRAYCYLRLLGGDGVKRAAKIAVLNSNYLLRKIMGIRGVSLPFSKNVFRKHEFVVSLEKLKEDTGVTARDVAKRLLDYGVHPPTIYFPLIVNEAFMIEPTESVSKEDLDNYYDALKNIVDEAYNNPDLVINSPYNVKVRRVDEAYGSRPKTMAPTYRWWKNRVLSRME